jgi:uncharacterized protein (TIGR00251 family)
MTQMFSESHEGVTFAVKVIPRARRDEIVGMEGDALKVRLNAPPVQGRANDALVKFLAKKLSISRAQVEIVSGETARRKRVRVRGLGAEAVRHLLQGDAG